MDFTPQQIQQILNNQARATNPLLLPRMEVAQVDGKPGADAFAMGPDSTALAMDRTYTSGLLVWFMQTDSTGKKVVVKDYDMTPHVHEDPPDMNQIKSLMESIAGKMDQQTTNLDELAKRVSTIEEALK